MFKNTSPTSCDIDNSFQLISNNFIAIGRVHRKYNLITVYRHTNVDCLFTMVFHLYTSEAVNIECSVSSSCMHLASLTLLTFRMCLIIIGCSPVVIQF